MFFFAGFGLAGGEAPNEPGGETPDDGAGVTEPDEETSCAALAARISWRKSRANFSASDFGLGEASVMIRAAWPESALSFWKCAPRAR